MSTFKITNITNTIGKREPKYNSVLTIEYIDKMMKKHITIKAGDTIFLTLPSLPISAHSLRVKNLITVSEVSSDELAAAIHVTPPKVEAKPITKEVKVDVVEVKEQKKIVVKKEKEEV